MQSFRDTVHIGADYIELDIRRTGDGQLVVYHDARPPASPTPVSRLSHAELSTAAGFAVPRVAEVFELLAGRALGHLDIKDEGAETDVVDLANEILGPGAFVVTTTSAESIARIRLMRPGVVTGLSMRRRVANLHRTIGGRASGREVLRKVHGCGADWLALNHQIAYDDVLGACHNQGIATMVWTVNDPEQMSRFLKDPRVTVLITDLPRAALEIRTELRRHPGRAVPATDLAGPCPSSALLAEEPVPALPQA